MTARVTARVTARTIQMAGRSVLLATVLSLTLVAPVAAQTGERVMASKTTPKRYIYPVIGAAVAGLASLVYFWSGPNSLPGTCGPRCAGVVTLGGGAFIGWLVGKEKDDLNELRYHGGMKLTPSSVSVDLTGEPSMITARDSLVAAVGGGGVQIFKNDSKPRALVVRAQGLRGVTDAILEPGSSELALTAGGGFYRFPMMNGQQGVTLRAAPAQAVAELGSDYIVGAGVRVERIRKNATETGTWPGTPLSDTVRALRVDSHGVVWALTTAEFIALRPSGDSMEVVSRTPMPRGSQRFALEGTLVAVAAGDSGVRFVSVADVDHPKFIADWRGGTRFAYDVALFQGKAYVASGIDGLAVVSLKNGTSPLQEGLARELGFIQAVTVSGSFLFLLENSGTPVLKRVSVPFQ